jgi:hypothetical protein
MVGHTEAQMVLKAKKAVPLIKQRILAVALEEVDLKEAESLKDDPDALEDYRQAITDFNRDLQEVVLAEWQYSKEIIFVTQQEASVLKSSRSEKHCILEIQDRSNYKVGDFGKFNAAKYKRPGSAKAFALLFADSPRLEIIVSYFPEMEMGKSVVLFGIQNLQNQLRNAETKGITSISQWEADIAKKTQTLKDKTLLIFAPFISKPLQKDADAGKISSYYTGQLELVDTDDARQVIEDKDEAYAYALVVPSGSSQDGNTLYCYYVVDAKDGSILYFNSLRVLGSDGQFHPYYLKRINSKIKSR